MDLLAQCQIWNENNQYQKIIDALEAIPASNRTPEMDSELARAYNNIAAPSNEALFQKAIRLLLPHAAYFKGDHCWNFRMAYAYYYLDQEGPALHYFQKALEARPGDADTQEFIDDCLRRLALPQFAASFRQRTQAAWKAFLQNEAALRYGIDADKDHCRGEELIAKCEEILHLAFAEISFELGFNGAKHELILSPEGDRTKLFELVYFRDHAPAVLLERWNILIGRQPTENCALRSNGLELSGDDVQVWAEKQGDDSIHVTMYCEKLLSLLSEQENRVFWMLTTLTDQILGEIPHMRYITGLDIVDAPKPEPAITLSALPQALTDMGFSLSLDAEAYLNLYVTYQGQPDEDPDADWRMDVIAGSTCCVPLLNDYLSGESDGMDALHQDGAAAGFLCYPLDGFPEETRNKAIADFQHALEKALTETAGKDALTLTGSAAGLYCGYVDLIAWDLPAVLDAAAAFFENTDLAWASFHVFRREVATVRLFSREDDEEEEAPAAVDAETGSLLSAKDVEVLSSFVDSASGYYPKMLDYLHGFMESGIQTGKFTKKQARRDLQLALWYAYACLNMNQYEYYYRAAQWMPDSQASAAGCGTWYYRYSVALMYCGRLEEARQYAEQGILEEPSYPWIWLQAGKLRCHFGDRAGALDAVARGLALVPGDHEFLTLQKEVASGATLEQMEYHWIHPDADSQLQTGQDESAEEKWRTICCITTDSEGLARFTRLFHPDPSDFSKDCPYCSFHYPVSGRQVELVFCMNEAGLSKRDAGWLETQKQRLDDGRWLTWTTPQGETGMLEAVLFGLDDAVTLIYHVSGAQETNFRVRLDANGAVKDFIEEKPEDEAALPAAYYSEAEMKAVEQHIEQYFGPFESVLHELESPDIHVDICLIPPAGERTYYTLVTMGMGAHRMNVPASLADHKLERAELAIALPSDWKLGADDLANETWYWPIRLLKALARLPIHSDTWLAWGHTLENREPFAENTELCAAILIAPQNIAGEGAVCSLPCGEEVNFYQVIPLYRDEMEYKKAHNADALLQKMRNISFVVDPNRPDVLSEEDMEEADDGAYTEMDDGAYHLECIEEKHLPVDEIAAFNHMAIYLRWCMEHDLMSLEFLERYGDLAPRFQSDLSDLDLRPFIRDALDGQLFFDLFDEEGAAFAQYYYGDGFSPYFPSDIDDYALQYFGPALYYSDKFQDEAYLFIPFDEDYYQAMAKVIQRRWDCWQAQEVAEDMAPSPLARAMMEYLNCECQYFPPMRDDDPITAALGYARRLGAEEGFVPVLLAVDEILWECFLLNTEAEGKEENPYAFDAKRVAHYRQQMLSAPRKDGKAVLTCLLDTRKAEAISDQINWADEILGEMKNGEPNRALLSYWDDETNRTRPLILAKIPVSHPWEVFAWLPFGGWNECPDTPDLMAVAKYWFTQYGAVPTAMTHDELEFTLPAPIPPKQAMQVAQEQYGFCPDTVDQGPEGSTVGRLADTLRQSDHWYFWWD